MPLPAFILPAPPSQLANPLLTRRSHTRLPRPSPSRSPPPHPAARPRATLVPAGAPTAEDTLEHFSAAIRGEWTGYEGNFCVQTGRPNPVPDYYIPEQFVEWGLIPHGFESNHSIIVRGTTLYRKFFRVLPAVSLFADHVDLEEHFSTLDIAAEPAVHVFTDGAFAAGPSPVCVKRESTLQKWPSAQFCLRDPRDGEQRALHVHLKFDFDKRELVDDLRAIREHFSCMYCDGADLEGSSGYVEGWVVGQSPGAEALKGEWRFVGGREREGVIVREEGPVPVPKRQIYLPDGVDVSVGESEGDVVVRVGWLVEPGTRVTMGRAFGQDGEVRYSERVVEHRI